MTATSQTELDDALIRQLSFKPGMMRDISVAIIEYLIDKGHAWSDEVDLSFVQSKADKNCIGGAWRRLRTLGLLVRTPQFRRSKSPKARGRTVFSWTVRNHRLAETFLARNGCRHTRQPELAL